MNTSLFHGTVLLLTLLITSACVPVAFFGAATSVTTSAVEERGMGGVIADTEIRTKINSAFLEKDAELVAKISIDVHHGQVLLTGTVDDPTQKVEAVRLAWTVSGVREVIDRIKAGAGEGFSGYVSDSWLTTKIKSAMLVHEGIKSINYNITTFGSTVHIMGIAQNQEELDQVVDIARNSSGVTEVVNHVVLKAQAPMPSQNNQPMATTEPLETGSELSPQPAPTGNDKPIQASPLS